MHNLCKSARVTWRHHIPWCIGHGPPQPIVGGAKVELRILIAKYPATCMDAEAQNLAVSMSQRGCWTRPNCRQGLLAVVFPPSSCLLRVLCVASGRGLLVSRYSLAEATCNDAFPVPHACSALCFQSYWRSAKAEWKARRSECNSNPLCATCACCEQAISCCIRVLLGLQCMHRLNGGALEL
jgi:hypothetical protein